MLEISNISKSYPNFSLKNISFCIGDGDYFVLLGRSGSGKSTLLEIIAGNTLAEKGKVILNGRDITTEKIQKRNIAFVYQDQTLFPHLTIFENIAFALKKIMSGKNEIKKKVHELSETVGVEKLIARKPGTLSGGESQRVALARALATSPECLLLDEPLSNIDPQLRNELRAILRSINRQGRAILHVTHDYEEAISLASNIAIIENGTIAQTGTPSEIFQYPKSEFVAKFIGVKNFYRGELIPSDNDNILRTFRTAGITIQVSTEEKGRQGFVLVPAENVVISGKYNENSSRNTFEGAILDIFPNRLGMEVVADAGITITSIVSREAVENLGLEKNMKIWVSFKATSAKFIEM